MNYPFFTHTHLSILITSDVTVQEQVNGICWNF